MAAITTTTCRLSPSTRSRLHRRPSNPLLCSDSFKPFCAHSRKPTNTTTLSRSVSRSSLWNVLEATAPPKPSHMVLAISGFENGNSETDPDELNKEAKMDIKLPRRSLLVQFTCNLCGERSQKLVNRLAYERGLIYVQCAGCLKHHKLVDNLGLVVEYDLRDEIRLDGKEDGV